MVDVMNEIDEKQVIGFGHNNAKIVNIRGVGKKESAGISKWVEGEVWDFHNLIG